MDITNIKNTIPIPEKPSIYSIFAIAIGNVLEFYDFTVYSLFAAMMGKHFFPTGHANTEILLSIGVFGVGFVSRPLGSFVIGMYADKYGRKSAMTLTIFLMVIGTALMALTPDYSYIGICAPLLIVLARLIQGFSVGGELGPVTTYMLAISPENKIGLYTSLQLVTQGMAAIFGGCLGYGLSISLSESHLFSWGWRIPFLIGLLIGPFGFYMRRSLAELPLNYDRKVYLHNVNQYKYRILLGMLMLVGPTITTYIIGHYMTTFSLTVLHFSPATSMMARLVAGITVIIGALLGGIIYDRWHQAWFTVAPMMLITLLVYPIFKIIICTHAANIFLVGVAVLSTLRVMTGPLHVVILPCLFPDSIRSLSISLCFSLSTTIFGGSAQFVVTYLLEKTGNPLYTAYYVLFMNMVSVTASAIGIWKYGNRTT